MILGLAAQQARFGRRHRRYYDDSYDDDGVSLYHVRGTDEENTRAVQVEEKAASLNAGDCFVLLTPGTMYVWKGGGANETELSTAQTVATSLSTSVPHRAGQSSAPAVVLPPGRVYPSAIRTQYVAYPPLDGSVNLHHLK